MANKTRSEVKRRYKRGQKVRKIAAALDISTQMVYHYLREMRRSGELPPWPTDQN